jgi:hypothetical protein
MSIYIDYNAETVDGKFFARLSRLDRAVSPGETVETHDEDKNQLAMIVDEVDEAGGIVYLRPNWSTWIDGDATTAVHGLTLGPGRASRRRSH